MKTIETLKKKFKNNNNDNINNNNDNTTANNNNNNICNGRNSTQLQFCINNICFQLILSVA